MHGLVFEVNVSACVKQKQKNQNSQVDNRIFQSLYRNPSGQKFWNSFFSSLKSVISNHHQIYQWMNTLPVNNCSGTTSRDRAVRDKKVKWYFDRLNDVAHFHAIDCSILVPFYELIWVQEPIFLFLNSFNWDIFRATPFQQIKYHNIFQIEIKENQLFKSL